MEKRKVVLVIFSVAAIILGWTLYKQFNFESLTFKNTGLAIIYSITFVFSIYVVLKNYKNRTEN